MSNYKITYNVKGYETLHSRYYQATTPDEARDMFELDQDTILKESDVTFEDIVCVYEQDDDIHESDCGCGDSSCGA